MDDHQVSLEWADGLNHDLYDLDLDTLGNFEDMQLAELDCLFGEQNPHSSTQHSFDPVNDSSQDLAPSSSFSPDDTDLQQYTPSSTAYDLRSDEDNVEHSPVDLVANFTDSSFEVLEHISPYSSISSEYSHVSQLASNDSNVSSPSEHRSRNPISGPAIGMTEQQWPSRGTVPNSSGAHAEASSYHDFSDVTTISAGPYTQRSLSGMTLPLRNAQTNYEWTPTSLHSLTNGPSWGGLHEQSTFLQHRAPSQFAAQHIGVQNVYDPQHTPTSYAASFYSMPVTTVPYNASQQEIVRAQSDRSVPIQSVPEPQAHDTGRAQTQNTKSGLAHSTRLRFPHHPSIAAEQKSPTASRRKPRPIAVANHEDIPPTRDAQDKRKVGGRGTGTHLNPDVKIRISRMRKKGACWRCKLQRDPCPDDGTPCARCIMGSQKGQLYFFGCDRSKLPDFVMDFLPPSYTIMHSKQNIEDCVRGQVRAWDYTRPVEVCLTSGYGHPLHWTLYEFEPTSLELLGQFQYLQNMNNRQAERFEKWSPPLGLTKLEPSDDWHFKNYLDQLMLDEPLAEFPWTCFEEESQINDFQATMLAMICELYRDTNDHDLHQLLHKIIRMLIVTYIMGHTLTITEETLPMVQAHLRSPYTPAEPTLHTSPRLANRQLKFFFRVIRDQIYEDILKWQQATLHTSGGKNTTWLSTFVVMLAFAMVLEETQRTIQIQADAKQRKRELSYDDAQQEASNACERIDERYRLLIGLFQCKYRDKKWVRGGSFGPQTPRLRDPIEHRFCTGLRDLLEERQNHLRSRKDVPFSSQNQCQYTTRLVARFLLPFLELPC